LYSLCLDGHLDFAGDVSGSRLILQAGIWKNKAGAFYRTGFLPS
jgi:hypothetical protein